MTAPNRYHLPETRESVTRRVSHSGDLDIYITVGFFEEHSRLVKDTPIAQPGEVFIKLGKEGSTLGGLADNIAVMMSLLLQYGVPWDRVARKLRFTNYEPRNENGMSIAHAVVCAVDGILSERGCDPKKGYEP